MNPTIEQWLQAINSHDVDTLESLGSDDHTFFVEGETPTVGKATIKPSWVGYFKLCPNYVVLIDEYYELPDAYYLIGHTAGSHVPSHLEKIPSSVIWRCEINGGTVSEWSIYEASDTNRERFNLPKTAT